MRDDRKQIKFLLLLSQIISYSLFLASHFLVWGIIYTSSIPIQWDVFIGIESVIGIWSIIGLNLCLVVNLLINGRYTEKYKTNSLTTIIGGFSWIVIYLLVFLQNPVTIAWHLYEYVFGFYLWLFAAICTLIIGVIFYILFKKEYFIRSNSG